jgi:L-cysteine:1D-myo-inositol 2-amino-2-deoxy-alpha-D-glucopyranoside ligase
VIGSVKPHPSSAGAIASIRAALANDLDAPAAIAAVDDWVERDEGRPDRTTYAGADLRRAIDALLGVKLY